MLQVDYPLVAAVATLLAAAWPLLAAVRLPPGLSEAAFWRSDLARGWLRRYDLVFGFVVTIANLNFMRKLLGAEAWAGSSGSSGSSSGGSSGGCGVAVGPDLLLALPTLQWDSVAGAAEAAARAAAAGAASGAAAGAHHMTPAMCPAHGTGGGAGGWCPKGGVALWYGFSPWGWPFVFLIMGLIQIWVILRHQAQYRRFRHPWMLAGRLLRIGSTVVQSVLCGLGATPVWEGLMAEVRGNAATAPLLAVCGLLYSWSGATFGLMNNVNVFVPMRWALPVQLLQTAVIVHWHSPGVVRELHPQSTVIWPAYTRVCCGITAAWERLSGLYVPGARTEAWCMDDPRAFVVLVQVVLGAIMPLCVVAGLERMVKQQYVAELERRRYVSEPAEQGQWNGLGSHGEGSETAGCMCICGARCWPPGAGTAVMPPSAMVGDSGPASAVPPLRLLGPAGQHAAKGAPGRCCIEAPWMPGAGSASYALDGANRQLPVEEEAAVLCRMQHAAPVFDGDGAERPCASPEGSHHGSHHGSHQGSHCGSRLHHGSSCHHGHHEGSSSGEPDEAAEPPLHAWLSWGSQLVAMLMVMALLDGALIK